jgi:hypothetical protein
MDCAAQVSRSNPKYHKFFDKPSFFYDKKFQPNIIFW